MWGTRPVDYWWLMAEFYTAADILLPGRADIQ
jgi:hypothetical protein